MFCLRIYFHFFSSVCRCSWRADETGGSQGAGVKLLTATEWRCWKSNTSPLQEQQAFLVTELAFQPAIHRIALSITGEIPLLWHVGEKSKYGEANSLPNCTLFPNYADHWLLPTRHILQHTARQDARSPHHWQAPKRTIRISTLFLLCSPLQTRFSFPVLIYSHQKLSATFVWICSLDCKLSDPRKMLTEK